MKATFPARTLGIHILLLCVFFSAALSTRAQTSASDGKQGQAVAEPSAAKASVRLPPEKSQPVRVPPGRAQPS
ncbi:MAG: hypothetical protein DMF66_12510 [Acidobacteria bacterium]|nr:MAG: hypothetical protein DMF66_12510 [Acidobacteriota bacterium]